MKAALLLLLACSSLLLASSARAKASIEAGQGGESAIAFDTPSFSLDTLTDRVETIMNKATEQPADVSLEIAATNVQAFLRGVPCNWCDTQEKFNMSSPQPPDATK
jgi:hypothetical protein